MGRTGFLVGDLGKHGQFRDLHKEIGSMVSRCDLAYPGLGSDYRGARPCLIVGLWRKPTAVLAALLTLSFALSMTVVLGPHEPLNYYVFVFAFASLYLGLSQDVE
jgi:hypothetical protein